MSEDKKEEPVYTLLVPNLDKLLSMRANRALQRKIFDEFMDNLGGSHASKANLKLYFGEKTEVNTCIDTGLGRVEITQVDNTPFGFEFYRNIDLPRSIWRAGQLLHHALTAACSFYNPELLIVMIGEKKPARDLVAVRVDAQCGDNKKSDIAGVIPLHYSNGRVVKQSKSAIKEFEQEIIDELNLTNPAKNPGIKYHTSVAYAWHQNHGILPGFGKGRVPMGLEVKIISSDNAPLRSDA